MLTLPPSASPRSQALAIVEELSKDCSYPQLLGLLQLDYLIERGLADLLEEATLSTLDLRRAMHPDGASTAEVTPRRGDVQWTQSAKSSLQQIHSHVASDRPTTARRTIESIIDRAQALTEFPALGQPYPHRQAVRILTYGSFRIPYRLDDGRVVVLGVFR